MFQLFLANLLKSGRELNPSKGTQIPKKFQRNRRMYERFEIDHKHMALVNAEDILLIRDISTGGFCAEVSERCYERLVYGDIYSCNLRYLGDKYVCKAEVIWKAKQFVGFKLIDPDKDITNFFKRLIIPLEIASSLKKGPKQGGQKNSTDQNKIWYYGEDQTVLTIWLNRDDEVSSWKIEIRDQYLSWTPSNGVETGDRIGSGKNLEKPWEADKLEKYSNLPRIEELARDILMAAPISYKEQLLESFAGNKRDGF